MEGQTNSVLRKSFIKLRSTEIYVYIYARVPRKEIMTYAAKNCVKRRNLTSNIFRRKTSVTSVSIWNMWFSLKDLPLLRRVSFFYRRNITTLYHSIPWCQPPAVTWPLWLSQREGDNRFSITTDTPSLNRFYYLTQWMIVFIFVNSSEVHAFSSWYNYHQISGKGYSTPPTEHHLLSARTTQDRDKSGLQHLRGETTRDRNKSETRQLGTEATRDHENSGPRKLETEATRQLRTAAPEDRGNWRPTHLSTRKT